MHDLLSEYDFTWPLIKTSATLKLNEKWNSRDEAKSPVKFGNPESTLLNFVRSLLATRSLSGLPEGRPLLPDGVRWARRTCKTLSRRTGTCEVSLRMRAELLPPIRYSWLWRRRTLRTEDLSFSKI